MTTAEVTLTTTTDTQVGPGAATLAEFFDRLWAEECAPLQRYVRSLIAADPHRAEDVVQETLLRAWLNAHQMIRERMPVRSWLFRVARNITIDWHRRDMARPREVHVGPLARLPETDDRIAQVLDRAMLTDAMGTLPRHHREVLYHLHYCDRSGRETAELVGVPQGTVKSRSYYASRAMRRVLQNRGVAAA